jgi:hypothetical protein
MPRSLHPATGAGSLRANNRGGALAVLGLPSRRVLSITVTGRQGGGPTVLPVDQAVLIAQYAADRVR